MIQRHISPAPCQFTNSTATSPHLELELLHGRHEGCISYRLGDHPPRTIAPGHRLYRTLTELLRVIGAEADPLVEAYEQELHDDVIAYEAERRERENVRLYLLSEPRRRWRVARWHVAT